MKRGKYRFLIIDDVLNNLITLKALMKEAFPNAEVVTALGGEIGLKFAKEEEPDVILLDILMPNVDGFEVCRKLKADPDLEAVPVLFMSAIKNDRYNRLKALDSGGEAFLNKPVDEVELYVQVRSMLKIREKNLSERARSKELNELVFKRTAEVVGLQEKYKDLLDDLPAMICEYLPDATLTYVNRAYCQYFNRSKEELIGIKFLDLLPVNEHEWAKNVYRRLTPENPLNCSSHHVLVNGEIRWQEWRDRAIFDDQGRSIQYYSIGVDITERKKAEDHPANVGSNDNMTGLYNRRFFEGEIKRLDHEKNFPLTLAMADVNGLKIINDSFGHLVGDQLLKDVAGAMEQGFRESDVIARIGGDEFAIILAKTDGKEAEELVHRVKRKLSVLSEGSIFHSVSFGFETKKTMGADIHELFAQAENDMYRQKVFESASLRSNVVEIIMNSLFEKSKREMSHSKRVGRIAASIASALNFTDEHISEIRIAGDIHDIGKIGVAEEILNKDGKLDQHEWQEIKKHPEAGRRILSSVDEFKVIADYVIAHHERWDGKGYPKGLSGEEIPVEARIIAIADSYDAMTSERSYRIAMGKEEALAEIERHIGSQFDPRIARVFIAMETDQEKEIQTESDPCLSVGGQ